MNPPSIPRGAVLALLVAFACGPLAGCGTAPAQADGQGEPATVIQEETRPLGKPAAAKKP